MIGLFSEKSFKKQNRYEIADVDALARSLHAEGKAVYPFLANNNPEQFSMLYENLTYPVREYV
jgi:hypothetical protein